MPLYDDTNRTRLREAGWHSRGYLPHFDGRALPQFITIHLAGSIPTRVIRRWRQEFKILPYEQEKILLQRRIERYLDQGYGQPFLKIPEVAAMVQNALLKFDDIRYRLFSWVVMPNHVHCLMMRFEEYEFSDILHSLKSFTAHEANKMLGRDGQFWIEEYFDRYIRNQEHFERTVRYIENNPVKATLCRTPEEWPYSSAWFKRHGRSEE
jgi:REP element-mobilizing transposase RayT